MCRRYGGGMDDVMKGENLRYLRKGEKLTQTELAKALGISASAIGMYEQNRREPDDETLIKLCQYFDVPSDYFILGNTIKANQNLEDFVDEVKESLRNHEGLMFNGSPLDRDDLERIATAIQFGVDMVIGILQRKDSQK